MCLVQFLTERMADPFVINHTGNATIPVVTHFGSWVYLFCSLKLITMIYVVADEVNMTH